MKKNHTKKQANKKTQQAPKQPKTKPSSIIYDMSLGIFQFHHR